MVIEEIKNGEYVCDNNHSFINIKFQDDYELVEQKPAETEKGEKLNDREIPNSELNLADKVEPKFKVGDWVVNNNGESQFSQVIARSWPDSKIKGAENNLESFINTATLDKQYQIWTIQDAKDGDVLVTKKKNIFIFKSISGCTIYDYCGLYFGKFMEYSATVNGRAAVQLPIDYAPATKEQRELLFQKMNEAGYEWDADKKELKKIEEEVNGEDYGIDSLYHAQRILEKTLGKVDGYQSDDGILEHKCAISAVKKLYEHKPAWSEEDEKEFEQLLNILHANGYESFDIWLKSLKERYTWKPSEEQIECLYDAVKHYQTNGYPASKLNKLYEQMSKIYKL